MKVVEHLVKVIRNASLFNSEVQEAPSCILWTDSDRQWESAIPVLYAELPELLIFGDYRPDKRTGPAIWLRCVIAGKIESVFTPGKHVPIVYLPGVSRQDLRVVENCPDALKPLIELQFRGVIWSQINGKDWTIPAYLKTDQGGLGLDIAQDGETKNAAQLALYRLLDEEVQLLKGKRLDKNFFNMLLTGGDPERDLLQWLNGTDDFRNARTENEWKAFVEISRSKFAFDPQNEGALVGAANLANHEGPWASVWERFCEAPKRYPNIAQQIRRCQPPSDTIFWHSAGEESIYDGWPQWNEEQEQNISREHRALAQMPAHDARRKLGEMERQHGRRRLLVWAELGEAPLAMALKHLGALAQSTTASLAAGTAEELAEGYSSNGWKADNAAVLALAEVQKTNDFECVSIAIRSVYLPWMEESARYLQQTVDMDSYPGGTVSASPPATYKNGDCVLFVDGLRFDAAKRLSEMLIQTKFKVSETPKWSALPSVTATGKPAVTPVKNKIRGGDDASADFEPAVAETGQSLRGGYHLKKLLKDNDWKILGKSDDGDGGQGNAWCEFGDIDHEGHDRGWKLAKHLDSLLSEIRDRIEALLTAGWKRVIVVTDHGWLLMPGGLPKIELNNALVDSKWGRCAAIKAGASTDERLFPWYWNPSHHFALADGVSCFKTGEEYAHGGLSLQECLTLELSVTAKGNGNERSAVAVEFTDIVWKGLRCTVAVNGNISGLSLDVRAQPGNAASSVVVSVKSLKENGTASVVVEDEDLEGREATLVLLDADGALIAQNPAVIGGGGESK